MTKKVAFINGKGGCGKTTSIFHVAGVLASREEKVLVIDLDKQRNSTRILLKENPEEIEKTFFDFMKGADIHEVVKKAYFRSRGNALPKYYGVDVLPSDKRFEDEKNLQGIDIEDKLNAFIEENGYTWVLIDMPPSNKRINDICFGQITDNVISPFSSDMFSIEGYDDLMEIVNEARTNTGKELNIIGIYLSRYDNRCGVDRFIREQLEEFDTYIKEVQIPLMSDLREGCMLSRPMSFYKQFSKSRAAYEKLTDVIEKRINELN